MPREVEWADDSERDLRRLDRRTRERIRQAVYRLATDGYGDVKKLQGRPGEWRLRVGDWRVLFTFEEDRDPVTLLVLRVLPRGRAYRP
jgi:mRNA interferase RelE/StbE